MSDVAKSAVEFLKKDLEKAQRQWKEGKPFEALLQRKNKTKEGEEVKTLKDLLKLFDPEPDEIEWLLEYAGDKDETKLRKYRQRIAFLKASRKEFHEEYDEDVTDVDFMRLLELPFTDPKDALEFSAEELKD